MIYCLKHIRVYRIASFLGTACVHVLENIGNHEQLAEATPTPPNISTRVSVELYAYMCID